MPGEVTDEAGGDHLLALAPDRLRPQGGSAHVHADQAGGGLVHLIYCHRPANPTGPHHKKRPTQNKAKNRIQAEQHTSSRDGAIKQLSTGSEFMVIKSFHIGTQDMCGREGENGLVHYTFCPISLKLFEISTLIPD